MSESSRKLAAILFADIAGYTALMQKNEELASTLLRRFQKEIEKKVMEHNGRVVNFYGDGALCIFNNPLEAVRCAMDLQTAFQEAPNVPVRIGLHSGTVVFENEKVYGDSVNLASRIESMSVPGAILISKKIRDEIKNQPDIQTASLGSFAFKNVEEPIEVFALTKENFVVPKREDLTGKFRSQTTPRRKWLVPTFLFLAVAIAGIFYFFSQDKTAEPTVADAITIFPFDIKSGNPDIQYLSDGMVDLISTKLEGVPNLNPIDPNRVFNELDKSKEEIPVLESATKISNTLGASEFVLGNIIEINDNTLQISASKYDVAGALMARESIEGQKTQLAALIDGLTRSLIADKLEEEGQELNSIAIMTSEKLPALKAYLEGEQAFRNTEFVQAFDDFKTAVDLDSTFAMAWYRLYSAIGWGGNSQGALGVDPLDKAIEYSDKLPPKWQDLIKANKMWESGQQSNENIIGDMLCRYGENAELTNLMAEHIFHYYSIYGRPFTEAKPWLEKSRKLDPKNLESLRHLGDIAWAESDTAAIEKYMDDLPADSRQWVIYRIRQLTFKDTVTETEIKEVVNHPWFTIMHFVPIEAIPENPNLLPELGLQFEPYVEKDDRFLFLKSWLAVLRGQEKEAISLFKEMGRGVFDDHMRAIARIALIISSRSFLPYEELYPMFLDSLATHDDPRAFYASAKYAWVLGLEQQYQNNKNKLVVASKESHGVINPARYFHWSLAAFEARQQQDNEKALICIDSAFSYSPTTSHIGNPSAAMDKIFMLADIYEEQEAYEKSIQHLENIPMWHTYHESKGYATYRLTQLYEKNGEIEKALAKCQLFLRNYRDCDEKYKPWLNEVMKRQKNLLNKID